MNELTLAVANKWASIPFVAHGGVADVRATPTGDLLPRGVAQFMGAHPISASR
jgi:hypothetical protein